MQTESQDLIMEAFNGTGTFGSVLTADHSFLNADLATFYGIPTNGLGTVVQQRQVRRPSPRAIRACWRRGRS